MEHSKEVLPMGLDEIYANTLMESGEIINEHNAEEWYIDKITDYDGNLAYELDDPSVYGVCGSGGTSRDLYFDADLLRKKSYEFLKRLLNRLESIDTENTVDESISKSKKSKNEISESSINNHSKAFYSQMYDWVKDNEDALDFMKKEFVDAYRNSTNKNEYMNNLLKSGALSKTDKEIEDENINYGKIKESIKKKKSEKKNKVTCPKCKTQIWDKSSVDQRLNKCWKCGLKFDNPEEVNESQKSPLKESVTAYNGIYLSVIPERGGLKLSLTESGKGFAEENGLSEINFWEIFDDIESNSDYSYIANLGNAGFGLTEAPGILYGYEIDDDGELIETPDSELFVYDNYMIDDFGVKLAKNGSVIFHGEPKRNNIDESCIIKYRINKNNKQYDRLVKIIGNDAGMKTVDHNTLRSKMNFFAAHDIVASAYIKDDNKKLRKIYDIKNGKIIRIARTDLDEKSDPLYKNHKGLYKTSINGFKVFEYNGKFIVYFNVGKKEHAFNWNGGSRSWEYLKNKLENITPEQALSDKELM